MSWMSKTNHECVNVVDSTITSQTELLPVAHSILDIALKVLNAAHAFS